MQQRLTTEVAFLGQGDPQVCMLAAKAVSQESRERGSVFG